MSTRPIEKYRKMMCAHEPDAECLKKDNASFLLAIGAAKRTPEGLGLTVAGLLVFGTKDAIRRCMPLMRVDYIRTGGNRWMSDLGRETDSTPITGRLPDVIARAHSLVMADLPIKECVNDGVERKETSAVPSRVVREAIVNSVMHRDYRVHGPVQIIKYPNRLEIRNPGYSLKSNDVFKDGGSFPRNPLLSSLLHCLRLAETRGMGMGLMYEHMNQAGLYAPYFDSNRATNTFSAFLMLHELHSPGDEKWIRSQNFSRHLSEDEEKAIIFAREMGAINVSAYQAITGLDSIEAGQQLRRLAEASIFQLKGHDRI